jgi:hypothetical protein
MATGNLFEFEGPQLVREFSFRRSAEGSRLVLAFETDHGSARLLLLNPQPVADLFSIIGAEQVWISIEEDSSGGPGQVKVEAWHEGFLEFHADDVVDLHAASYDTLPETPVGSLAEGAEPGSTG